MDNLKSRLDRRAVSRSGVVHSAYVCNRETTRGECEEGLHPWCYYAAPGTILQTVDEVTCRRCLTGGSPWQALVNVAIHPELGRRKTA